MLVAGEGVRRLLAEVEVDAADGIALIRLLPPEDNYIASDSADVTMKLFLPMIIVQRHLIVGAKN